MSIARMEGFLFIDAYEESPFCIHIIAFILDS